MEVILDSSFIVSCVKKKIDFLSDLKGMGFRVLVPKEVVDELKDLRYKGRREDRLAVEIALKLIETSKVEKMSIGKDSVDKGLIRMGKNGAYIASLDREIKRNSQNRVVIIEAANKIEIERD